MHEPPRLQGVLGGIEKIPDLRCGVPGFEQALADARKNPCIDGTLRDQYPAVHAIKQFLSRFNA